jgi:Flp pilus assembly protein TadD
MLKTNAALLWVIVGTAGMSGCATMPGGDWFSSTSLSLPSPSATLSAAKWGSKKTDESASIGQQLAEGRNHERAGQSEKARKVYEELRVKHPENGTVAHRLAIVADTQRRHGEAEQLFLFALEKDPQNAEIMADLGYCYYLQGKLDKAEKYLGQAVDKKPTDARARNNLGLVLGHMGRDEDALTQFKAAGSEANAYFNLAFVCASQDRVPDAKTCFKKALAVEPTHRQAREALLAFEEYDALPPNLQQLRDTQYADGGVRFVPHVEGGDNSSVQQASGEMSIPSNRDAGRVTRELQNRSRGLGNRNMSSQRNDGNGQ